ncbi:MAG: hypothetical protein A2Y12_09645 [Planctomycetes bacterium GWF2_42_9]|nr:MAG: hypothetical protein A2Y12_09645 [Planctomycetes bacterium GWF2_42_9]
MFKRSFMLALVALFATQVMATIVPYDTVYNADQLPDLYNGGTLLDAKTISIQQEALVDIGGGNKAWEAKSTWVANGTYVESKNGVYNPKLGVYSSIEFRLKITAQPNPAYEAMQIFVGDDQSQTTGKWKVRGFMFASNYIVETGALPGGQGTKVTFDTATDFVTYKLNYKSSTATADLYYYNGTDWSYLLSSSVGRDFTGNPTTLYSRFRLGDDTGTNYLGTYQVDYIAWNQVPEPATICLLGLGFLAFRKRTGC